MKTIPLLDADQLPPCGVFGPESGIHEPQEPPPDDLDPLDGPDAA